MKHIGNTVKELVEAKGIKKKQFARDIDLAPESLSRFFNHSSIQCELLDKICHILDVPPSYFFISQMVLPRLLLRLAQL